VPIELQKEYAINADIGKVWDFLTDLNQVTGCIPNLESLQIETPTKFRGKIRPPFSFVKGWLGIESEVQGLRERESLTVSLKGSSIGASFQCTLQITFSAGTKIQIHARVETFGLLKTIPKSLIYKAVEEIETPVLKCIKAKLE
jgi:carbon monoxide dehydrogenase subunit G